MLIITRRLTIITLAAALFAISFSAAVRNLSGNEGRPQYTVSYACLLDQSAFCRTSL